MFLMRVQRGFTLIEVAFVLLIVAVMLGYTVAMFPKQQELKQYRGAQQQMDEIIAAVVAFAQVNGRLPCPALPNSGGFESTDGTACVEGVTPHYGGFVPVNTLGLVGNLNADDLLLDPWNNPYRYYVSNTDADGDGDVDFVTAGEMRDVGLVDTIDYVTAPGTPGTDGYIDLDGRFVICAEEGAPLTNDNCDGADTVFGRPDPGGAGPWAGAPFVLLSMGKNWSQAPSADEAANRGGSLTTTNLFMAAGPSGNEYLLKNFAGGETTFVRRTTGQAEDYDDLVRWASPNLLFSKMIDAGQLP